MVCVTTVVRLTSTLVTAVAVTVPNAVCPVTVVTTVVAVGVGVMEGTGVGMPGGTSPPSTLGGYTGVQVEGPPVPFSQLRNSSVLFMMVKRSLRLEIESKSKANRTVLYVAFVLFESFMGPMPSIPAMPVSYKKSMTPGDFTPRMPEL